MKPSPSLVAQAVKTLPAMQEPEVRSLGQEDPLEKGMATHSSIHAWRISWTEGGHKELDMTNTFTFRIIIDFGLINVTVRG